MARIAPNSALPGTVHCGDRSLNGNGLRCRLPPPPISADIPPPPRYRSGSAGAPRPLLPSRWGPGCGEHRQDARDSHRDPQSYPKVSAAALPHCAATAMSRIMTVVSNPGSAYATLEEYPMAFEDACKRMAVTARVPGAHHHYNAISYAALGGVSARSSHLDLAIDGIEGSPKDDGAGATGAAPMPRGVRPPAPCRHHQQMRENPLRWLPALPASLPPTSARRPRAPHRRGARPGASLPPAAPPIHPTRTRPVGGGESAVKPSS